MASHSTQFAAILLCAAWTPIHAQTPDRLEAERVVFHAFPEANAFRCIRKGVDQAARREIERRLPFRVHFNELGEHCLLVAFRGRRPVGLVYQRTEETDWGLTDIAWGLSLDLRVTSLRFLHGRNRFIRTFEQSQLARRLRGLDFAGICEQIELHEQADHDGRPEGLVHIERTALRSAAKALLVTDTTWRLEVDKLHDRATGFDLFPAAARFTRRSTTAEIQLKDTSQSVACKVLFAYDSGGSTLGFVAWTTSEDDGQPLRLRWTLDRDLSVMAVTPVGMQTDGPQARPLREACTNLRGRNLRRPGAASEPLVPLARTLGAMITKLGRRKVLR